MSPWPFLRTLIDREVVASTSDLARDLVHEGRSPLPLAVRAARQTRGRGRGRNAWWSDAGSLTFTIALDPSAHALRPEHEPRLALTAAVAIVEAVSPLLPARAPGIRWPNDVEVGGRKLGGILPERVETEHGPRLLIGIGLNVRTHLEDAPIDVRRMATTIEAERGSALAAEASDDLLGAILDRFGSATEALSRDDPALATRWERLDTLAGQWVRVDLGTRLVTGLGRGIDAEGRLRLLGESGIVAVAGGQVLRD